MSDVVGNQEGMTEEQIKRDLQSVPDAKLTVVLEQSIKIRAVEDHFVDTHKYQLNTFGVFGTREVAEMIVDRYLKAISDPNSPENQKCQIVLAPNGQRSFTANHGDYGFIHHFYFMDVHANNLHPINVMEEEF